MSCSKYAAITEEDLQSLLDQKNSNNTKRLVKRSVALFREYLGERSNFEDFSKEELNTELRNFFASVRNRSGENVKTSTLNSYKYGLSKHLKEKCSVDISKDKEFSSCQQIFKAKVNDLKKCGLGSVEHKPPISSEDLKILYDKHSVVFNVDTPCGLQYKVWFDLMYFLCRRGRENLRSMTKSAFAVASDATGLEYVYQNTDEADKNHGSKATPDDTIGEGRMYARPDDLMCPVASFKKYIKILHPALDALWQRPSDSFETSSIIWYCKAPVGKNPLSNYMVQISKLGNLSKIYTSHSIRATSITAMDAAGIEARHIMRTSGHKSESSIRSYSNRLTERKKREISSTLSAALSSNSSEKPNQFPEISEEELLEVFRDDNVFVEVTSENKEKNFKEQNKVSYSGSRSQDTSRMSVPVGVLNQTVSANTNYFAAEGVDQLLRNVQYSINPTMNNSNVHFHFYGNTNQ